MLNLAQRVALLSQSGQQELVRHRVRTRTEGQLQPHELTPAVHQRDQVRLGVCHQGTGPAADAAAEMLHAHTHQGPMFQET